MKDTLPKTYHVQNYLLPSNPPENTPRLSMGVMLGCFGLVVMDGLIIKHLALDLGKALLLLLLATGSTVLGGYAANSVRLGGPR